MSVLLQNTLRFFIVSFLMVGFVCGAAVLDIAFTKLYLIYGVKSLEGCVTPPEFPVLVITQPNDPSKREVRTLLHGQLAGYLATRPDYTFQVPQGMAQTFSLELAKHNRNSRNDYNSEGLDPWFAEFEIMGSSGARQQVRVRSEWDDGWRNEGWYEASEKEITPLRYKNVRTPRILLDLLPVTFFIMIVLYVIGFKIWNVFKRRDAGLSYR